VSASPAASKSAQLAKLFWIEEGGAGLRADAQRARLLALPRVGYRGGS
jgi:hypothetical protein